MYLLTRLQYTCVYVHPIDPSSTESWMDGWTEVRRADNDYMTTNVIMIINHRCGDTVDLSFYNMNTHTFTRRHSVFRAI